MTLSSRFVSAIALGFTLVQLAVAEQAQSPPSGKYWVYIGTYTSKDGSQGIYRCELDVKSGSLGNLTAVAELANPTFLSISPNGRFLYAVSETADAGANKNEGSLQAFKIDPTTGKLSRLNSLTTGGAGPCYVSVNSTGRFALVANYGGGSSAMFRLNDDGSLERRTDFRQHEGKSVNPDRQTGPHAHCAMFNSDWEAEYAYVVDLGLDKVFSYKLDPTKGELIPTRPEFVKLPDGSGPRHIAFNKTAGKAYVCGELDSTLITLRRYGAGGLLERYGAPDNPHKDIPVLSTLPEGVSTDVRAKNSTAEVLVHPDHGHVLVSNRGHDSLAVFRVNADETTRFAHITSAGERQIRTPRNFNIDPTGQWILIASQDGDTVQVAQWDAGGGGKLTGISVKVANSVCVKFVPKP
jgi:6-phosphogluconolactonase